MKPLFMLFSILLAVLLAGCNLVTFNPEAKNITPSDTIISETRAVSGFTGIDMRTIGSVTIAPGEAESLVIKGSDNLVPLVKTSVRGGTLVIEMENVNIQSLNMKDILAFEITVKDLDQLTVSGLGTVEMSGLATKSLDLVMSGAGAIKFSSLAADSISVAVSGLGDISLDGKAADLDVNISGAGDVMAAELEVQTADVQLSGLGAATLWVTEKLTGEISGAGSVRYYGEPTATTNSTGLGQFESLGEK